MPGAFQELSAADAGTKPRIKPHFTATQGYNSNANLGAGQKDSAWQARIAPGVRVSIPSGKLYTEVDYTYGFSTTQGRETHANISTHNLNALARYDLSEETILGVSNNIQFSEVPGLPNDTFILETANAQVKHKIGTKLTADLQDTFQYFNDRSKSTTTSRDNDFWDNGVALNLPYDVTSDLIIGPSFAWNVRDFDKIREKDYWQILPAVRGSYRIGPKTTFYGNMGWTYRNFEVGSGNESEIVYGAGINHLYGRRFVWNINYQKSVLDTFDTTFVTREIPEATIFDNVDRDYRVLKSHRLNTSVDYHFNEKNTWAVFGGFQFLEGDAADNVISTSKKNREKSMEVGTSYTYRINKYISFDLRYTFGRRFSGDNNLAGGRANYTYHRVSSGFNVTV